VEPPGAPQREASGPHTVAHTDRLRLDAVVPDDLDAHHTLMSDPAVWEHLPSGRHTSPERTAEAHRAVEADRPVIACRLEHNVPSRVRAERAGLSLVWRGPDAGNPDPAAVRLVFSDRTIDADLLARISALP
jgi:hypothetical protein